MYYIYISLHINLRVTVERKIINEKAYKITRRNNRYNSVSYFSVMMLTPSAISKFVYNLLFTSPCLLIDKQLKHKKT